MSIAASRTVDYEPALAVEQDPYLGRAAWLPLPFLFPVVVAGTSWMGGGVATMTDLAFFVFTVLGLGFLTMEFARFPRRFGIGGMVIFGGYLTWFCYDYMKNWFGWPFTEHSAPFTQNVVAKAAYFHMLFIFSALVGLMFKPGRRLVKLLQSVPEPHFNVLYLWLIFACLAIGLVPYIFFTADAWYEAMFKGILAARGQGGIRWTISRSAGRFNTNWLAYVAHMITVGYVGGQLAVFYAILICRNHTVKLVCWVIWAFWFLQAFGTGTRGNIAFMGLPVLALLYLKYQSHAAMLFKKASVRAYIFGGLMLFVIVMFVQIQGQYRTLGYRDVSYSEIDVLDLKGNSMFSEGLPGWEAVPDRQAFFSNRFPGEALVRPIPETAFWFVVKFIPRALWHNKPLDPMEEWYGDIATEGRFDATVSTGIVGEWYFRYGWLGVVQGGLLFGWLARSSERALQTAAGRPMAILLSLGLATWLFRTFRNFIFHDIYPLIIGAVVFFVLVTAINHFAVKGNTRGT